MSTTADVEDGLRAAVLAGTYFGDAASDVRVSIDADLVRELVVSRPATGGVQIGGATIHGLLDLREARAVSGGACNALILRNCVLEGDPDALPGDPGIDAAHSHLARLALIDCQSDGVELSDAVIDGDLELDGLHQRRGGGGCWVKARGARVCGSVTAARAKLSLPWKPKAAWPPNPAGNGRVPDLALAQRRRDYWDGVSAPRGLDLQGAEIAGAVVLQPDFEARGVNVGYATIGGTLWAQGAKLLASKIGSADEALRAQLAKIGGGAVLNCDSNRPGPAHRFHAAGRLDFYGATVEGLQLDGALIEGPDSELQLYGATLGGDVRLIPDDTAQLRFGVRNVSLGAATIAGSLWLEGSRREIESLQAVGVKVKGDLDVKSVVNVNLSRAVIDGNAEIWSRKHHPEGVDLTGAAVGGSLRIVGSLHPLSVDGRARRERVRSDVHDYPQDCIEERAARLQMSRRDVKRDLKGIRRGQPDAPIGQVRATGVRVAGDLVLGGFVSNVDLSRADVGRNLRLLGSASTSWLSGASVGQDLEMAPSGVSVDPEFGFPGIRHVPTGPVFAQALTIRGALKLHGSFADSCDFRDGLVDGDLELGVKIEPLVLAWAESAYRRPSFDLEGTVVRGALKVASGFALQLPEPFPVDLARAHLQLRAADLAVYPGWRWATAIFDERRRASPRTVGVVSYLYRPDGTDRPVILDGDSARIHEFNDAHGISLDDETKVKEYLALFADNVWGEAGPFLVTDIAAVTRVPQGEAADVAWRAECTIWYAEAIFRAVIDVQPNGNLEMSDDEPVEAAPRSGEYRTPLQWIQVTTPGAEWPPVVPGLAFSRIESASDVERAREAVRRDLEGRRPEIDLRGVKTASLYDGRGRNWGLGGAADDGPSTRVEPEDWGRGPTWLIALNGFEYDRIDDEPPEYQPPPVQGQGFDALTAAEPGSPTGASPPRSAVAAHREDDVPTRLAWLRAQYSGYPPTQDEYQPAPYHQLAKVLHAGGEFDTANEITYQRLKLEKTMLRPPEGAGWRKRFSVRRSHFYWKLLKWGFGFALKPRRAWGSVLLLYAVGVLAVYLLAGWMKVDTSSPSAAVVRVGRADRVVVQPKAIRSPIPQVPCGDQINKFVYPLDVMVPFVDLHQESRCRFANSGDTWSWPTLLTIGRGIYTILGWAFVSGLLITLSGVVKRRLEN